MKQQRHIPVVLTIAGSDSGGGAGIQADIKTISATGSYACSVITAVTAQNTLGVDAVYPLPTHIIAQQLDSVFRDLNIIAVKVGMLAESKTIQIVADKLSQYQPHFLVVDPLMISSSGTPLIDAAAITTLIDDLLPMADLITPNLPEAAILTAQPTPENSLQLDYLADLLRGLNFKATLLKGGHSEDKDRSEDWLITSHKTTKLTAKRIRTTNTHGTGCTLSSAIASFLAQGDDLLTAVSKGKEFISNAIEYADKLKVGQGIGPVHHFYAYY